VAHLVFQTAFPGDLFLSIPLLKRIKEWDIKTPVVLACRPGLGDFFKTYGLADEVITIDKKSTEKASLALAELKSRSWDTVFVPHESVRTALWMWRLRAKRKVAFRLWWNGPFYDTRVLKPADFPDALRQLSLLARVDSRLAEMFGSSEMQELRSPSAQSSPFDFRVPQIPEWAGMQVIPHRPEGKRIFFAPGSVWATKRWTARGYEDLARLLIARGFDIELVGSADERELCEQIAARVNSPRIKNRAGLTSLSELVEKLSHGTALISNDSGAMHAAAAAGLPTVALFGPTTLELGFRPWQNHAVVVQRALGCRPCGKHGHQKCPIGTHECMEKIPATEVLAALDILQRDTAAVF